MKTLANAVPNRSSRARAGGLSIAAGLAAILVLLAGLAGGAGPAVAEVTGDYEAGFDVGPAPNGMTKAVGFGLSYNPRYKDMKAVGIRIVRVHPDTYRLRLAHQFGGGLMYDGPVSAGQFIPFNFPRGTVPNVVATGWKSSGGNSQDSIRYRYVYR